jgi:hypothetical protein
LFVRGLAIALAFLQAGKHFMRRLVAGVILNDSFQQRNGLFVAGGIEDLNLASERCWIVRGVTQRSLKRLRSFSGFSGEREGNTLEDPQAGVAGRGAEGIFAENHSLLVVMFANQGLNGFDEGWGLCCEGEGTASDEENGGAADHLGAAPAAVWNDPVRFLNGNKLIAANVPNFFGDPAGPANGQIGGGRRAQAEVKARVVA